MTKTLSKSSKTHRHSILERLTNYAGWPLLFAYFVSMFVWPWLAGDWSWQAVQTVWDRWQTLNAGALAFVASLVAFNIARFNENRQRERDFIAARAFLPSTLSSLMEYCSKSAQALAEMWSYTPESNVPISCPEPPSGYREVFSNCIRHADPRTGWYLSKVLVSLQIHDARLRDASDELAKTSHAVDRPNLLAYLLRLAELYSIVARLFPVARGEEEPRDDHLSWDDLQSAYSLLNLELDDYFINDALNLEAFTKRWIHRQINAVGAQGK